MFPIPSLFFSIFWILSADLQTSKQVHRDIFLWIMSTSLSSAVLSFPPQIVPHQADLQRTSLPQCSIWVLALSCPVSPMHCLEVVRTIDNILVTVRWDKAGHWEWGDNQEAGWLRTLHLPSCTLQLCSEISQRQMQRADPFLPMLPQKSSYGAYLVLKLQKICWNSLFSAVRL